MDSINPIVDRIISSILLALFYFIIESLTQRSVAKFITGTKVVMINGDKPIPEVFVKRSLSRLIPFDALSFLGSKSRGWHDSISKTYVIDVKKYDEYYTLKNELDSLGKDL